MCAGAAPGGQWSSPRRGGAATASRLPGRALGAALSTVRPWLLPRPEEAAAAAQTAWTPRLRDSLPGGPAGDRLGRGGGGGSLDRAAAVGASGDCESRRERGGGAAAEAVRAKLPARPGASQEETARHLLSGSFGNRSEPGHASYAPWGPIFREKPPEWALAAGTGQERGRSRQRAPHHERGRRLQLQAGGDPKKVQLLLPAARDPPALD